MIQRLQRCFLILFLVTTGLTSFSVEAKVFAQFHPRDPSLQTIATYLHQAQNQIDIAMYNMDSTPDNPIIEALTSPEFQNRIQSGDLTVRMVFEGYEAQNENNQKMAEFEALGIDVRYLGSSKKVHHKFAVIDAYSERPVLISGSANWSLNSQRFYNENILFFENEPAMALAFQEEFNLLWEVGVEFGRAMATPSPQAASGVSPDPMAFFNTENFKITESGLRKDSELSGYTLTREVVELIDEARSHIEIATTRIKLRPIYEALVRAAARGVKVQIVVTMGEYTYKSRREKTHLEDCMEIYDPSCSSGHNFAIHLAGEEFPGHENVDVRIKFFNLNTEAYLSKQMHSKYILVDGQKLLTGSFNWSYSAEYNHIENLIRLEGSMYQEVLNQFSADFATLWSAERDRYTSLLNQIETAVSHSHDMNCDFEPMTLEFHEIDYLLSYPYQLGSSPKEICL